MQETRCAIFSKELCGHGGRQHWACSGRWKKLSPEAQREYHLFFAKYRGELENWRNAAAQDWPPV